MENDLILLYKNKENENILPVCYPPPLKAHLPLSIVANIITANEKNYNWILENFIQLFQYIEFGKVEMFPIQPFLYFDQKCLQCTSLDQDTIPLDKINLIDDIIYWIDKKMYVIVYVNEFILPGARLYKKSNILHSQFIFGYDKSKQIFKMMNFSDKVGDMEILDIPFDTLENAFYSDKTKNLFHTEGVSETLKNKEYCIYLLKYRLNNKYYINYEFIKENLYHKMEQYIKSINSSLDTIYFTGNLNGYWGVNIYDQIGNQLSNKHVDFRTFCMIYEHKLFMKKRIELFNISLSDEYQSVVDKAYMLKQICYKYMMKKSELSIEHMHSLLIEIKKDDIYFISILIKDANN